MKAKTPKPPARVETHKHKDKRANIPTEELRDFVADDEKAPKKILYPRDPSLDPQLVWKGKDEQDRQPLEVPAVPIYIQEKIHPRVIIENLRAHPPVAADVRRLQSTKSKIQNPKSKIEESLVTSAATEERRIADEQLNLFASDFNGIKFEQLIEFYQHKDGVKWANRMILGDSLLVMNSLAEKEGLKGQVQMIYLDPPYGIKFGSNWQVSTRKRDVKDGKAEDATRQPEQIRAFRDTWKLGIHSYLAYLRDRLTVARELLTESGSVFVQIGDENLHVVRSILDEVFGSENFVSLISFKKTTGATGDLLPGTVDYIVWYAKNIERVKYRQLYRDKALGGEGSSAYTYVQTDDGTRRLMTDKEQNNSEKLAPGIRAYRRDNLTSQSAGRQKGEGAASWFHVAFNGQDFTPGMQSRWKTNELGMERLRGANRLTSYGVTLAYVRFIDDFPAFPYSNFWDDTTIGYGESKVYVVQTSTSVVERCLLMTSDPGDLVLDPTCGSGTTAYVAEQWGRRWITCDTSRVAIALARTRLMAAKFPYYLLADSEEGWRK
ncbi:MAG: site-specific DNA-methyltransferase, partial [Verrucomicrobiales bacterium]|nr:site-specific DNA-methyltransferase [Verrucomicrobiales bacterium]